MRRLGLAVCLVAAAAAAGAARAAPARHAVAPAPALAPPPNIQRITYRPAGGPPAIGPADALVTVELFFIPGATQSHRPLDALLALQARHPRRIRLVFRPLSRQGKILVPEAAMEAHAQGKFLAFIRAIDDAGRNLGKDQILRVAASVGVDPVRLAEAWDSGRHEAALRANEHRRQRHYALSVPDALFNAEPVTRPLPTLGPAELDDAYRDAYDRAIALLDDGVPRRALPAAFDRTMVRPPTLFMPGPVDDAGGEPVPSVPPLVTPPLDLRGLPTTGPTDAPVVVVVLCDLTSVACPGQLLTATQTAALFPDKVRIVWSPWWRADLAQLDGVDQVARVALCAEAQGAGWRWVDAARRHTQRVGRRWSPDAEALAAIATDAEVDSRALAACLKAQPPDAARRRVEAALARGIRHGPAVIVGGHAYLGGVAEPRVLQSLIEDELEPGILARAAPDWGAAASR